MYLQGINLAQNIIRENILESKTNKKNHYFHLGIRLNYILL